ncbi:MAG: hypothetical protein ACP5GZ_00235 [Vulcanisaeta sp.]|uniref:Uncharacterized protein n=1 Tax=Vulcanisaeta moutnovskia (strain 768-28) TaxID=985053 RepID=F0QSY1_VULM7|nr:hypothetical protein [Vulcanisaeta moutnovskia]ADY00402.1 hypothetical protein VMUT_0186 [Vulcanisaeta moutnovskia 768-28]
MLPKFLITRKHPILPLRLSNDTLCIAHRDKYLDFITSCNEAGNYIMIIPYQGSYVNSKPIEPITWSDLSGIEVYTLLRDELALYELSIKDGKASYVRYRINEEFLRGISFLGNAMNELLSVTDAILMNYIKSSFMIYTAYLRLITNSSIKFPGYKEYIRGKVRIYSNDGLIIVKESSGNEVRVSLVSTIEGINKFTNVIMTLIKSSRVINDVRLGRIGHSVKMILDVFIPNNLLTPVNRST